MEWDSVDRVATDVDGREGFAASLYETNTRSPWLVLGGRRLAWKGQQGQKYAHLRPRLFRSLPVSVEIRVSFPLGWLEIVREAGSASTVVSSIWGAIHLALCSS